MNNIIRHTITKAAAYITAAALTAASFTAAFSVNHIDAYALDVTTGTQSYKNRVISVCGIADTDNNLDQPLTRAEFAKMLVLASSYKDTASVSDIAAAFDVPANSEYASYVRVALSQNWMRTKLNGGFAPNDAVSLLDASKAAMTALGYTDTDFSGNVSQGRLEKFKSLELNSGVNAVNGTDTLTRQEGINIIYNLLKTKSKNSSSIYGTSLKLTLSSDGELNATDVLEVTMVGPKLVKSQAELKTAIPFDLQDAVMYYNGETSGSYTQMLMYYGTQIENYGWLILYYNENNKNVWGYGQDNGDDAYYCTRGKVTQIKYEDDNIISPSSVCVEDVEYELSGSDVKFMFSANGGIKVGDVVVLICKKSTSGDVVDGYYATGVIKYDTSTEEYTVGTRYLGPSNNM